MAPAKSLTPSELQIIKGMLELRPKLKDQEILAYFSRPHRDLNHRLIGQIRKAHRYVSITPASKAATHSYMAAVAISPYPDASLFAAIPDHGASNGTGRHYLFLDWWPVGQGLFSSGTIMVEGGAPFSWVYDCGTTSRDGTLATALSEYKRKQDTFGIKTLDLATLSHFDKDHISGFSRLVTAMPIRIVLLPYLNLFQRLILAIQQGVAAGDAEFGFYLDPVAYLSNLDGSQIGQFVFVQPSRPEDGIPPPPVEPRPDWDEPDERRIKFEKDDAAPNASEDGVCGRAAHNVHYLCRGSSITVPFFWEFLPYNDAAMLPKVTMTFKNRAARLIRDLLDFPTTRQTTLDRLKRLYDKQFGKSSFQRNIISLFLYSGPLDQKLSLLSQTATHPTGLTGDSNRFAQMYTGDGSLRAGTQFRDFDRYYTPGTRLYRAGIFQVMHHGAKGNWHQGLGAIVRPTASIFSSDPNHSGYRHPHAPVLRDFWPFYPVQVNDVRGFHMVGIF